MIDTTRPLSLLLDSFGKIALARLAVEREYARGGLSPEEARVCRGNLDEAAALLRLRRARGEELS